MLIESADIALNPGIVFDEQKITTARVRLLPRRDRKPIELLPVEQQDDRFFVESISRLGSITDRDKIALAAEELFAPDEERIWEAMRTLKAQHSEPDKSPSSKSA